MSCWLNVLQDSNPCSVWEEMFIILSNFFKIPFYTVASSRSNSSQGFPYESAQGQSCDEADFPDEFVQDQSGDGADLPNEFVQDQSCDTAGLPDEFVQGQYQDRADFYGWSWLSR